MCQDIEMFIQKPEGVNRHRRGNHVFDFVLRPHIRWKGVLRDGRFTTIYSYVDSQCRNIICRRFMFLPIRGQ